MPLDKSGSKDSVGKNIGAEMAAGKSRAQSIAIALHTQDKAKGRNVPPPPRSEGPNMNSRDAHAVAAKKLGKHMKDYSIKNVPTEEEVDDNPAQAVGEGSPEMKAQMKKANGTHMPPGKGK